MNPRLAFCFARPGLHEDMLLALPEILLIAGPEKDWVQNQHRGGAGWGDLVCRQISRKSTGSWPPDSHCRAPITPTLSGETLRPHRCQTCIPKRNLTEEDEEMNTSVKEGRKPPHTLDCFDAVQIYTEGPSLGNPETVLLEEWGILPYVWRCRPPSVSWTAGN